MVKAPIYTWIQLFDERSPIRKRSEFVVFSKLSRSREIISWFMELIRVLVAKPKINKDSKLEPENILQKTRNRPSTKNAPQKEAMG